MFRPFKEFLRRGKNSDRSCANSITLSRRKKPLNKINLRQFSSANVTEIEYLRASVAVIFMRSEKFIGHEGEYRGRTFSIKHNENNLEDHKFYEISAMMAKDILSIFKHHDGT